MALTKITPQMFDTSAAGHDFNIDNGTFVVDASANRVGIGTTTPSTLLDVDGTATATTFVGALTGNVTGNLTGTILTAAQTNITSVGTLSSLLTAAAKIKLTDVGNATVAALQLTDAGLGISSPATDQMNFITADATRAVIDANGKVGIGSGATSPASLLHVDGAHSGGPIVTIHQTAGSSSADSGLDVETSSTGTTVQRWLNSGTELARITGSGNVGIGTNNPGQKLDVQGTVMLEKARLSTNDGTTYWDLRRDSSTGHFVISDDGLGDVITVRQDTGNVGIGNASPGQSLHVGSSSAGTTSNGIRIEQNEGAFDLRVDAGEFYLYDVDDSRIPFLIDTSGNIGIGTNTPGYKLEVNGTAHVVNTLTAGAIGIPSQGITLNQAFGTGVPTMTMLGTVANGRAGAIYFQENGASNTAAIYSTDGAGGNANYGGLLLATYQSDIRFSTGGLSSTKMIVKSDGKVGIGTASPAGLLTIKGTGDAIRVESTNTGTGGAQLDLLHHTTSPADDDTPGAVNFGGYYSGTTPAYSAAVRSIWRDVSAREGKLVFLTRNGANFNTNMEISHNGIVRVAELSDMNATGAVVMHRYNIGAIANYTKDFQEVTHAGIDHYTFTIQGNNTYQTLFNNVYTTGFEMIVQLGDAASRDQASYAVNATSPAYGVSSFNQNYYHNGGWNTGSFEFQMIATPGDNTEYSIQVKFTSYYSSSNNATGYVQIRRLY